MTGEKFCKNLISINVLAVFYSGECGMVKSCLSVCCGCLGFFSLLSLFFFFLLLHLIMEHRAIIFIRSLNIYANSCVSNACQGGGISQLFLADCSSFLRTVFSDLVVTVPAPCLKWSLNIAIVVVCSATVSTALLY